MRELKFRVWSEEDREYRTDCDVFKLFHGKTGCPATIYNDEGDRFDIEQYTGLKDKNGKEIYEGDIVEALIDGVWETGRNTVSFGKAKWRLEVLYNDIRFMDVFKIIGSKSNPDRIYYLFDKELSELEAIGNVHENADLLEEKE